MSLINGTSELLHLICMSLKCIHIHRLNLSSGTLLSTSRLYHSNSKWHHFLLLPFELKWIRDRRKKGLFSYLRGATCLSAREVKTGHCLALQRCCFKGQHSLYGVSFNLLGLSCGFYELTDLDLTLCPERLVAMKGQCSCSGQSFGCSGKKTSKTHI